MIIRKPITKPVMRSVLTSLSTAASEAASALAVPPSLRSLLFHDDGTATEYPAYYTEEEWAEHSHLLKDYSLAVGDLREKRLGYCYDFDGVDDYIAATIPAIGISDFSFAYWVKLDDNSTNFILEMGGNNKFESYSFSGILFRTRAPGGIVSSATGLIAGVWYHIAATFDRNGVGQYYINGVANGTPTDISSGAASILTETTLYIAKRSSGDNLNGSLFGVRIYNDALTADEITYIYTNGQSGTDPGSDNLVAHYPLQEESGATAYDISGNGHHGTILNAVTSGVGSIHQPDAGVVKSYANDEGYSINETYLLNIENADFALGDTTNWYTIGDTVASVSDGICSLSVVGTSGGFDFFGIGFPTLPGLTYTARLDVLSLATTASIRAGTTVNGSNLNAGSSLSVGQRSINFVATGSMSYVSIYLPSAPSDGSVVLSFDGISVTATTPVNTIIPAASSTQDAIGGTLTYTGRGPNYGLAKGPAWQGDGSTVYVDLGAPVIPSADDYALKVIYKKLASGSQKAIFGTPAQTGSHNYSLFDDRNTVGTLRLSFGGGPPSIDIPGATTVGDEHLITLARAGNTITASCKNLRTGATVAGEVDISSRPTSSSDLVLLTAPATSIYYSPNAISPASITTGGITTTYSPIEGTRNVAVTKSDGTYSVITDAVKNGALATLYSDGDGSWRLPAIENGANFDGTGLYPAAPGASVAANGNALNIPANKHPIGVLVDRTGGVAAPFDNVSGASNYTDEEFNDIPTENTLNKRGLSIYAADRYGASLEDIQS